MELHRGILGKHAVETLTARVSTPVLTVGTDRITRADLAGVMCFNFVAASMLSRVLNHELQVKNLTEVYNTIPPRALALPGLGVISLATLGAAFEARGIGTLASYVERHMHEETLVTFDTYKHQVHEQDEKDRRTHRRRGVPTPAARRYANHRTRAQRAATV